MLFEQELKKLQNDEKFWKLLLRPCHMPELLQGKRPRRQVGLLTPSAPRTLQVSSEQLGLTVSADFREALV